MLPGFSKICLILLALLVWSKISTAQHSYQETALRIEPMNVMSAYKYQDGLYYYEVTKDVATNFFISRLRKGNYVFEYRLRVAQQGNFATGITSVQSMYAPEFNAHSEGERMNILK